MESAMFFAETLGPVISAEVTKQMYMFVKSKVGGACTNADLRAAVGEFLRIYNIKADPDAMIDQLTRGGYVATQQGSFATGQRFQVAA